MNNEDILREKQIQREEKPEGTKNTNGIRGDMTIDAKRCLDHKHKDKARTFRARKGQLWRILLENEYRTS